MTKVNGILMLAYKMHLRRLDEELKIKQMKLRDFMSLFGITSVQVRPCSTISVVPPCPPLLTSDLTLFRVSPRMNSKT